MANMEVLDLSISFMSSVIRSERQIISCPTTKLTLTLPRGGNVCVPAFALMSQRLLVRLPCSSLLQDDIDQFQYAVGIDGAAKVQKTFEVPNWHPLRSRIWNGTCRTDALYSTSVMPSLTDIYEPAGNCDAGQLTAGGLQDSFAHGRDLWSIYGGRGKNPIKDIGLRPTGLNTLLRTSPEERTFQVAGGLLHGMGFPREEAFESIAMPSTIDGIVPSYSCSYTDELRNKINVSLFVPKVRSVCP